ncbi:site-specific integrase, partial [Streptomyces sp. TRM76130]|nr:site-specific integrase [Streptomyces sp. TRM76130]
DMLRDPLSYGLEPDLSDLIVITATVGSEWEDTVRLVKEHIFPLLRRHRVRYIQVARCGPRSLGVREPWCDVVVRLLVWGAATVLWGLWLCGGSLRSTRGVEVRMRAFPVRMPAGTRYWTVVDDDLVVVEEADRFLRELRLGRGRAESTTKAHAGGVALFMRWCASTGRDWRTAARDMGLFMLAEVDAGGQRSASCRRPRPRIGARTWQQTHQQGAHRGPRLPLARGGEQDGPRLGP